MTRRYRHLRPIYFCLSWLPGRAVIPGEKDVRTESDHRFYSRRAAEERLAARRSVTDAARHRHEILAAEFSERAQRYQPINV